MDGATPSMVEPVRAPLTFDDPRDSIDCMTEREPDESLEIETLGVTDSGCTTGRFNFGLGPCSYACERLPA